MKEARLVSLKNSRNALQLSREAGYVLDARNYGGDTEAQRVDALVVGSALWLAGSGRGYYELAGITDDLYAVWRMVSTRTGVEHFRVMGEADAGEQLAGWCDVNRHDLVRKHVDENEMFVLWVHKPSRGGNTRWSIGFLRRMTREQALARSLHLVAELGRVGVVAKRTKVRVSQMPDFAIEPDGLRGVLDPFWQFELATSPVSTQLPLFETLDD